MIASNVIDQIRCSRVLFIQILLQQVPFRVVYDVCLISDVAPELQVFLLIHFGDLFVDIRVLLLVDKLPLVCACIEDLNRKQKKNEKSFVNDSVKTMSGHENEFVRKQKKNRSSTCFSFTNSKTSRLHSQKSSLSLSALNKRTPRKSADLTHTQSRLRNRENFSPAHLIGRRETITFYCSFQLTITRPRYVQSSMRP